MVRKHKDGRIIKEGKAWDMHPYNWASSWSDEDKKRLGLTWEDLPASAEPYDTAFYLGRKADGTLIERSLTDTKEVDKDGKPIIDPDTDQQAISKGLKTIWIERTKRKTNSYLSKWDWQVTRKYEKDIAIDSNVSTYRDAVRTACTNIEKAINDCSSLSDFQAMFVTPKDSDGTVTGKAPMYNFPDEI